MRSLWQGITEFWTDDMPQDTTWRPTDITAALSRSKRLLEEAHVEVQAAQNKVTQSALRMRQAMEEMAHMKKLLEANSEPAGQ